MPVTSRCGTDNAPHPATSQDTADRFYPYAKFIQPPQASTVLPRLLTHSQVHPLHNKSSGASIAPLRASVFQDGLKSIAQLFVFDQLGFRHV